MNPDSDVAFPDSSRPRDAHSTSLDTRSACVRSLNNQPREILLSSNTPLVPQTTDGYRHDLFLESLLYGNTRLWGPVLARLNCAELAS